MNPLIDSFPVDVQEAIKSFLLPEEDVILAFFFGSWSVDGDVPDINSFLRDYEFLIATNKKIILFPQGWYKKMIPHSRDWLITKGGIEQLEYEDILFSEIERYIQCSSVRIHHKRGERKLDKCQHIHAERINRLIEERRKKDIDAFAKSYLAYPLDKGQPLSFQFSTNANNEEILSVMFVRPTSSAHVPPVFSILQYRGDKLIKEYCFEPKKI